METINNRSLGTGVEYAGGALIVAYVVAAVAMLLQYVRPF